MVGALNLRRPFSSFHAGESELLIATHTHMVGWTGWLAIFGICTGCERTSAVLYIASSKPLSESWQAPLVCFSR